MVQCIDSENKGKYRKKFNKALNEYELPNAVIIKCGFFKRPQLIKTNICTIGFFFHLGWILLAINGLPTSNVSLLMISFLLLLDNIVHTESVNYDLLNTYVE